MRQFCRAPGLTDRRNALRPSALRVLRRLGLDLIRLPSEYRVNFHNGAESTAQTAGTVDAALDLGRIMAAERAEVAPHTAGSRRQRRPRRMTPKAHNKRLFSRAGLVISASTRAPAPAPRRFVPGVILVATRSRSLIALVASVSDAANSRRQD